MEIIPLPSSSGPMSAEDFLDEMNPLKHRVIAVVSTILIVAGIVGILVLLFK